MKKKNALCILAGAGPGDLGLVTLRTREAIERADVVVYDYLVNPAMLDWARAEAELIYVGKKAGAHTLPQGDINALLVAKSQEGKTVVRLKGGDPFVFGRGGEEAEDLAKAGVPFEIVPGVTSAVAAPAYAGIPVTHRDFASQLTLLTGHEDPLKPESALDWAQLAKTPGTLVFLMGIERLAEITKTLIEHGKDASTPVALVRWGTRGQQETLTGTLLSIGGLARERGFSAPAVTVIGGVVGLREKLRWFDNRPLWGKRVVVTRTRKQAGELSGKLRELGADVLEIPAIEIQPPNDLRAFAELVRDAHMYEWVVFTSPNGVEAFFEMFYRIYGDAREFGGGRIAAIGPATARKVAEYRFKVELQPEQAVAEEVVKAFDAEMTVENTRILVVRPEVSRDVIANELTKKGAIVDEAIAYRTVPATEDRSGVLARLKEEGADIVAFASSSAVEAFLDLKLPLPADVKYASIGPVTSQTMRRLGLKVAAEAKTHDIEGLVKAIKGL